MDSTDFEKFLLETISASISASNENTNLPSSENNIQINDNIESSIKNSITGLFKRKNGMYEGTLKFDLSIPENTSSTSLYMSGDSGIELNGNLNFVRKSRFMQVKKHIKKAPVFGVLLVALVSGSVLAASYDNNTTKRNNTGNSIPVKAEYKKVAQNKEEVVHVPASTIKPSTSQSPTAVSKTDEKDKNSGVQATDKKKNDSMAGKNQNKTSIQHSENKTSIISSGDNNIVINSNQSVINIEKE